MEIAAQQSHSPPGIAYLDGHRIRRAVAFGIKKVIEGQEHLNKINVFPVADGDTGTNLALTLNSVLSAVRADRSREANVILTTIADAALDGARGNSGAILAQFFQGVSDATEGVGKLSVEEFGHAVQTGENYAREALTKPREGTVLSVMRDFARHVVDLTQNATVPDFVSVLRDSLEQARASLARTTNQMEVLRKAGVVDAGAEGFVRFLEGIVLYIQHGKVNDKLPEASEIEAEELHESMAGEVHHLDYRYCTECMVTGTDINRRKLREQLATLGDSLVLAGTHRKAKIHIHVNDPQKVFRLASEFGEVTGEKADDMDQQQEISHQKQHQVAVIIDSAADMPDEEMERLNIHLIPVRLHFGDESYLDKVTITADDFYAKLQSHPAHPKTSQPSPGEFRRNFDFLASHFKHVLSINVTSWGSGTYQAAVSAAERSKHDCIHVYDSKSASVGQALLAIRAAECAQAGMPLPEILATLERARKHTRVFGMFPNLDYAVRGGRVKPVVRKVADFLKLAAAFSLDQAGRLRPRRLFIKSARLPERLGRYASGRIQSGKHYRVAIAYANNPADAQRLRQTLEKEFSRKGAHIDALFMTRLGTALGAHAGPQALVAGYLMMDSLDS
ncbi:MAG: DAK2 domain-containing protein [Gammaproteobacteria bacterium]|nr:DAK2 domain-containing protein [Gammaproteobacteria bacterium]